MVTVPISLTNGSGALPKYKFSSLTCHAIGWLSLLPTFCWHYFVDQSPMSVESANGCLLGVSDWFACCSDISEPQLPSPVMVAWFGFIDLRVLENQKDIRTGAIIGRDTKIKGLCYVDEVTQNGAVMLSHRTAEREAWLWHRRLGHPSNGYLHVLFPKLFPSNLVRGSECLDTLNWLRYVACGGGRSHSTADESRLSTQPEDHVNVTQTAPNLRGNVQEQEMVFNQEDTPSELNEHGVPPKRYSPEKVSRGSRYPMANIAKRNLSKEAKAFVAFVYFDEIPANTEQALKLRKWKKEMEEEMQALTKNNKWEKYVLPPGKKNIGCRWVFTMKYKPDAANKGLPLHQFDVKNAFLHGELKEEVYMNPHMDSQISLEKGKFTLAMKNHGFKQSNSDHTLFLKQRGNLITCLIIYVVDMIVTGDDKEEITKLKKYLFTEFEMTDLGRLKYFLGIEVLRLKQGIFMCQKRYILDFLAETDMIDCKPADTPMFVNQKLYMQEKAELANKGRYQRMVRKLIYLSHIRLDIAYALGVVSQFMHQPQKNHMKAVMRI
nr:putative reverse transcriptase, RNA-dependent DNA polymerase [Tanacetum cinerariifolium]